MTRVSTYNLHQTTIQNALNVQREIVDINRQVSSGAKADNFQGINGHVQTYVQLQDELAKGKAYASNNAVMQSRLNTTSNALGNVMEISQNASNLIIHARNVTEIDSLAFMEQMKGFYQQIATQMNTTTGNGTYVFSGTRSDQQAVNPTRYPTTLSDGVPDTSYYQGNGEQITAAIADGEIINVNVTGDDIGFQKIMAGFALAKKGFDEKDDALLAQAYDLVKAGIARVNTLQTSINASSAQIDQAESIRNTQTAYKRELKDSVVSADIVALSTQLAVDQGVLQAAFQAFARINTLQLSNFLPT